MNVLRVLVVGVIVGLAVAATAAEPKADNAKLLVGKWEATKTDEGTLPKGAIVEFTKDGKLKISMKQGEQEIKIEGTYKVEGDKFMLKMKMGDDEHSKTITIKKITETNLSTTDEDGKVVELTRKKK